jgi:hypothetical protein
MVRVVTLLDLAEPGTAALFAPVDDVVMGGRSASRLVAGEGHATFQGLLSLEGGGGFASVRSRPLALDLSGLEGLALLARGDGRRYKLNLRPDTAVDGVTWQAPFDPPPGRWATLALPFSAFRPTWRGRAVPGAGPLDRRRVETVGFLVSDRQAGPFRLELARLAGWSGAAAPPDLAPGAGSA